MSPSKAFRLDILLLLQRMGCMNCQICYTGLDSHASHFKDFTKRHMWLLHPRVRRSWVGAMKRITWDLATDFLAVEFLLLITEGIYSLRIIEKCLFFFYCAALNGRLSWECHAVVLYNVVFGTFGIDFSSVVSVLAWRYYNVVQ